MSRRLELHLAPGAEGATRGDLRTLAVAELAQIIHLGAKTARVALRAHGESGEIWFQSGTAIHAECGRGTSGTPAFYRMLGWKDGEFLIEYDVTTEKRSLEGDVMYHVFEGLRRVDEAGAPAIPPRAEPGEPPRRRAARPIVALIPLLALVVGGMALWSGASGPRIPDAAAGPTVADRNTTGNAAGSRSGNARAQKSNRGKARASSAKRETGKNPTAVQAEPAPEPASEPLPGAPQLSSAVPLDYTPAPPPDPFATPARAIVETAPAAREGWLGLVVRSKLDAGTLSVMVDGETIYSAPLSRSVSPPRAIFQRSEPAGEERFDARLPLRAGDHRLAARIRLEDGSEARTADSPVTIEPGVTRELSVVAGGKRSKPIAIELR